MKEEYDICIVGSGAGAGPVAYECSKAGLKVIVLEKGPWIKASQFTKDEIVASRREVYSSATKDEPQVLEWMSKPGKIELASNRHGGTSFWNGNCVGGASNFMSGYFHRLKPIDFRLLSEFGPIAGANIEDWPISYEDLEPFYEKTERLVGVSGEVKEHRFLEPRSTPSFPYPALETNLIADLIDKSCEKLGYESIPIPRAILSQAKDKRKACYYSNYCGSYGCSSDAKGSSRAALLDEAVASGNCTILPFSKVFHLETDGNRHVVKAHFHRKDESDDFVKAKIFVVAAQAIETSRLLLLSKNKEFPNGLANNSGQVGKNLLFSGGGIGSGVFRREDFGNQVFEELLKPGLFVNRSIHSFYEIVDFQFGGRVKGGLIDFLWEHPNPIRRAIKTKRDQHGKLLFGSSLKEKLYDTFINSRRLTFEVFNDWLPNANSFVSFSKNETDKYGDKVAKIRYMNHEHDIKIGKFLALKGKNIVENMGAKDITISVNGSPPTNLQAGGCRFGFDSNTSVLNPDCRAHDVDNLYITDGSFMPTGGSVPYTWTIYANSFRVATIIIKKHFV